MKGFLYDLKTDKKILTITIVILLGIVANIILYIHVFDSFIPGDVYLERKIEYLESLGRDTDDVTFVS